MKKKGILYGGSLTSFNISYLFHQTFFVKQKSCRGTAFGKKPDSISLTIKTPNFKLKLMNSLPTNTVCRMPNLCAEKASYPVGTKKLRKYVGEIDFRYVNFINIYVNLISIKGYTQLFCT